MNGDAGVAKRSAIQAMTWIPEPELVLYGNGNVTLAPAVKEVYSPSCLHVGDSVVFYIDTECDWELTPVITFDNCDSCEMRDVHWRGNDIVATCAIAPVGDTWLRLHWETIKSSRNYSLLDGNTVPGYGGESGRGPAHDDYRLYKFCSSPPPKIKLGQMRDAIYPSQIELSLTMGGSTLEMTGMVYWFYYDYQNMILLDIKKGSFLINCDWDYLHWNDDAGYVELEIYSDGASCLGPADTATVEVAKLIFEPKHDILTKSNSMADALEQDSLLCPIRFYWEEDISVANSIENRGIKAAYYDSLIYDYDGELLWDEHNDVLFPDYYRGYFEGTPDYVCLVSDRFFIKSR
jgi:hypothetical protein